MTYGLTNLEAVRKHRKLSDIPYHLGHALLIFKQILQGLCASQKLGICHRDMKEGNIVIAPVSDSQANYIIID